MRSFSGCSRSVFSSVSYSLCQSAVFSAPDRLYNPPPPTRHLEALVLTRQSCAVRFERLSFGYYCSAAAKNRLACTELLSGPGLRTERVHARSDLKLPCYCSAAAKNSSACNCCLALGFQPNGCIPDLD